MSWIFLLEYEIRNHWVLVIFQFFESVPQIIVVTIMSGYFDKNNNNYLNVIDVVKFIVSIICLLWQIKSIYSLYSMYKTINLFTNRQNPTNITEPLIWGDNKVVWRNTMPEPTPYKPKRIVPSLRGCKTTAFVAALFVFCLSIVVFFIFID